MKNSLLVPAFFLLLTINVFTQIPFPQDTIVRNDNFNNRMFAAYDSQGKIHLSYTGQMGTDGATREIYYVKEENNGSFTTTNITNNLVDDNYSTLSIDALDNIHIGFTGRDASNLFQIKYTNNLNGSFGEPIFITAGGLNKATPFTKIGPDSIVHFVYFTYTTSPDNIYYTLYNVADSTIQLTPTLLSAGEADGDFEATLDVDSQGKVYIVMKTGGLSGGPLKYMNNVTGTFTEVPTGVSGNITNPKVVIDKNDKVHIIYRLESDLRLYYLNNMTGSFSTPVAITPSGQRPAFAQNFAIDDSNRVYVVYQSSVSTSGKGFYFIYSNQNVFSDTLKIYDLTTEYVTRNSSAVITKGNGDIALFYAPGGVRNTFVICDIFMRRGNLFQIIPVELTSFTSNINGNAVLLNWTTASELNNKGFEIERASSLTSPPRVWMKIGFVMGSGTTTENINYSFIDNGLSSGIYSYRIKQIDYNGTYKYFILNESVEIGLPAEFSLDQNYPNPFNPSTKISWQSPVGSWQTLKVYDILGNEVATLVNEYRNAGSYEVDFNPASRIKNLVSGIYFYRLQVGNPLTGSGQSFVETKKMLLLK
ncbi:MAG TPA: T9SS type A sorting domain-containing protein [Ignavibacteriaceae bacterium]|nr:T9SS type A sorting domain-containing protein [Ignavibacteriaceae bacterium]HRP93857.1 T9SS type A sorting domain-containing protein [Ignavibacteriaceae bacterium]